MSGGVCGTVASKNVVWSCVSRLPASWCGGGDLAAVFILHTRFRESRFIFLQLHRWSRVEAHGFKVVFRFSGFYCGIFKEKAQTEKKISKEIEAAPPITNQTIKSLKAKYQKKTHYKKSILPALNSSCKEMLEEWEKLASAERTVELDSWTYCHDLTRNMLARASFGDSYKDGTKSFEIQQEQIDLGLRALRSVYIPGSKYLPTKFNKRAIFKDMIETKEKEIKRGRANDKNSDLLCSMLDSNAKQIKQHGPDSGLSLDDLIDDCKAFYLAGQHATSSLFVWTLVALSQHQDWQNKARDEISQAFGNNEPDFEGLSHLKVVSMILHEVLRLYSPAYFTSRITEQEVKLQRFSLPEGVVITIPMLLVHHDPDLWGDDVKQFKPERFINGVASATKGRLSFLPFSSGPRTCIGQNFSILQAKLFVAMILQRFSVELSPPYTHAPFPAITTVPQHGAHLIIRKV
ncbi:hypothetical protein HID58_083301 [Brassica napus]|uniref:Uncharacterized protein n=2 Tax=Brassica TaxID=3705 RepID=A0ABQ7YD35_BRANA|nr:hypothetical protein HID58_083301 [Brassica napus]